jgi:uncharacterized membrane protein
MDWLAILVAALVAIWLSKSFGVFGVLIAVGALILFRLWNHARRLNKAGGRRGSSAA